MDLKKTTEKSLWNKIENVLNVKSTLALAVFAAMAITISCAWNLVDRPRDTVTWFNAITINWWFINTVMALLVATVFLGLYILYSSFIEGLEEQRERRTFYGIAKTLGEAIDKVDKLDENKKKEREQIDYLKQKLNFDELCEECADKTTTAQLETYQNSDTSDPVRRQND